MDETKAQLDAHEKECAIRYEMVNDKLTSLDKRMWRLEAMIMLSTAAVIGIAATLLTKLQPMEAVMIEDLLLGLWPQLLAILAFAWMIARLSEKVAQLEKKVEVAFQLINRLTEETYRNTHK